MSNVPVVPEQDIVLFKQSNANIVEAAEKQVVACQEDVDYTNIILKKIVNANQTIEQKRKSFTDPLNQSLKAINGTFKELLIPLDNAKTILTQKVMTWRKMEQQRIDKENEGIRLENERIAKEEEEKRKKQDVAKEQRQFFIETPAKETIPQVASLKTTDSTQTRKIWKFEVLDLSKVPTEYVEINETKVNQAIRNGIREIAGIRIYQEEVMVIR